MRRPENYASYRNYQQRRLAELDAGDDPDDRTDPGDVQKLDEHVLPLWHRYVVDPVRVGHGGRRPVGRRENALHQPAVREVAQQQQRNS